MRYYGKEGPHCQLPICEAGSSITKAKYTAHGFLYGRVPRGVVLWLGLGLVAAVITMGFWGLSALSGGGFQGVKDHGSAIMIRR